VWSLVGRKSEKVQKETSPRRQNSSTVSTLTTLSLLHTLPTFPAFPILAYLAALPSLPTLPTLSNNLTCLPFYAFLTYLTTLPTLPMTNYYKLKPQPLKRHAAQGPHSKRPFKSHRGNQAGFQNSVFRPTL